MRKFIFGIGLLFTIGSCAQPEPGVIHTLDQLIDHAESVSLYREKVGWDILRPTIHELAEGATNVPDLAPALRYMLAALGDEHAQVYHNWQLIANYYSGQMKEHQSSFDLNTFNTIQMGQAYPLHAELLGEDIGYLRIIGIQAGNDAEMATTIQNLVCRLLEQGAGKWIIDLRYNGGGTMNPMVEGITTLIGDGALGGTKGVMPEDDLSWSIENGDFYFQGYSLQTPNVCQVETSPPIAVLTSVYTVSSGEAVAVALKGRENTRFFGQKTAGLITATDFFMVDDSTAMSISVGYYKDRNDVVYDEYVDVDENYPFCPSPLTEEDDCLHAAMKWLDSL